MRMRMGVSVPRRMLMFVIVRMSERMFALCPEFLPRQLLFAVYENIDLSSGDSTSIDLRDFETRAHVECRDGLLQHIGRHAGVDQGAQKHVATHAGEAVEIGYAHGENQSLVVGRWSLAKPTLHAVSTCAAVSSGVDEKPGSSRYGHPRDSPTTNDRRPTTNDVSHHRKLRPVASNPRARHPLLQSLVYSIA